MSDVVCKMHHTLWRYTSKNLNHHQHPININQTEIHTFTHTVAFSYPLVSVSLHCDI